MQFINLYNNKSDATSQLGCIPQTCSVKCAKVTYITINKRNIYHDYIFVSTVFYIQLNLKTLFFLDICTFFSFNRTKQTNKLLRSSQSFVSKLFTLITIYKIVNNISVL